MRKVCASVALGLLLALSGCLDLMSVHPLAAGEALAFDAGLAGEWTAVEEAKAMAVVRAGAEGRKEYDIIWIPGEPDEAPLRLTGRLARVGGRFVLDLVKSERPDMGVAGHFFFLYERQGDALKLRWLDTEWLRGEVTRTGGPEHVLAGGKPVITAGSAALAAFFARTVNDPRAAGDSLDFRRAR
jgi:hypothetical protein